MPVQTSAANVINKSGLANASKRDLLSLVNGLIDDVDTLRQILNTVLSKIDTAGGTIGALGTNNVATYAVAQTSLKIKK